MNPQEITKLKKNAMALRNIAQVVLAQVEQLETAVPTGPVTKKRVKQEIDLTTRLLTGQRRPTRK